MGNTSSGDSRPADGLESRSKQRSIDRVRAIQRHRELSMRLQHITTVVIEVGRRREDFEREILLENERFLAFISPKLNLIKTTKKELEGLDEALISVEQAGVQLNEIHISDITTSTVSRNISNLEGHPRTLTQISEEKLRCQQVSSDLQMEIDEIKAEHRFNVEKMRTTLLSYVEEEHRVVFEKKRFEEELASIDAELKFKLYTSHNTIYLYQEEHQKSMEIFLRHIAESTSEGDEGIEYPLCFSERYINDMELNWLYVVAAAFSQEPEWILEEENYIFLLTQAFFVYWCRAKLNISSKDSGDLVTQIGEEVFPVISLILKKLKPRAWDMLFNETVQISSARMFGERAHATLSSAVKEASSLTTMLQSSVAVNLNQLRQIILRYTETESKVTNMLDLLNRSIDYKISMSTHLTQECESWWTGERIDNAVAKIDEDRQEISACLQKMTISSEEMSEFNFDLSEEERICFEEVDCGIKVEQSLLLSDSADIDLSNLLQLAAELKDNDSSSALVAYRK